MDEHFLARLVTETLQVTPLTVGEAGFQYRRHLAKWPVAYAQGHFVGAHLVRFSFQGQLIDLPMDFGPARLLADGEGEAVREDEAAFFQAMLPLTGAADRLYACVASDGHAWLVFWDEAQSPGLASQLRDLFSIPTALRAA